MRRVLIAMVFAIILAAGCEVSEDHRVARDVEMIVQQERLLAMAKRMKQLTGGKNLPCIVTDSDEIGLGMACVDHDLGVVHYVREDLCVMSLPLGAEGDWPCD